jgi:hypothetical protein
MAELLCFSDMRQQDLEAFLEGIFGAVQAPSAAVGLVMVHPNYAVTSDDSDPSGVADDLVRCIQEQTPDADALGSAQGHDIWIYVNYPLLQKYVDAITLYRDTKIGSWVQVAPPDNFERRS